MKTLHCKRCGKPVETADDTTALICGTCVAASTMRERQPHPRHTLLAPDYRPIFKK